MTSTIIARRGFMALYREVGFYGPTSVLYRITCDGNGAGCRWFDSDDDAIAWFKTFKF